MKREKKNYKRHGFTIVELLTVMGVIAILISLLVPALAAVRDVAMELKQKAQFHAIEVGLDMYKKAAGDYPDSYDNEIVGYAPDTTPYCGANKLAEALVGLDYLGFHPNSDFRADGLNNVIRKDGVVNVNQDVYYRTPGPGGVDTLWQTRNDNIKSRSYRLGTPFVDLENANVFELQQVYSVASLAKSNASEVIDPTNFVLCDVYTERRSLGDKTGTPILYFKARTEYTEQDFGNGGIVNDIYNLNDNLNLLELGKVSDDLATGTHQMFDSIDDELDFQGMILNRQLKNVMRPYRAGSYIMMSAGKDGDFGTADDILNFEVDE